MLKQNKILVAIILIGFLAALGLVAGRYHTESLNRRVEMTLDWDQVRAFSRAPEVLLRELAPLGVASVAVTEQTLGTLRDSGRILVESDGRISTIRTKDAALVERILLYLNGKYGDGFAVEERSGVIKVGMPFEQLRDAGVGLAPEAIRFLKNGPWKLKLVARLSNFPSATARSIRWDLEQVKAMGIRTVVFSGDQVLGFSGLTDATATALKELGLSYGAIEFGKQKGDEKLSQKLGGENLVRVHSISSAEIWQLTPDSAVERYVRAARERNIRLLYVRLFDAANDNPIEAHRDYIKSIAHDLERAGFTLGAAHPYAKPHRPLALVLLVGFGVVAGGVLLLKMVFPISTAKTAALSAFGFIVVGGLLARSAGMGPKMVALLASLIFPTLAFMVFRVQAKGARRFGVGAALAAIPVFLGMSAVTMIGAAMIAGILATLPFMLRVDQFMGIKLANVLPIFLVMAIYIGESFYEGGSWADYKKRLRENYTRFFSQPMLIWQILALGAVMVIFALLVMRSGNDAGVGVSPLELKMRAILDRLLVVRPRTKELMFGHPALLIALALGIAGRKRWIIPFAIAGSVGQVSLLNTFCHLHTPLALSALRAFNGVVLGILLGVALVYFGARFFPEKTARNTGMPETAAPGRDPARG